MYKRVAGILMAGALVAACTTDPYTGQERPTRTASGAVLGAGDRLELLQMATQPHDFFGYVTSIRVDTQLSHNIRRLNANLKLFQQLVDSFD